MIRRDFIKTGAIAAGSLMAPVPLFASQEKIKLAILGTGAYFMRRRTAT